MKTKVRVTFDFTVERDKGLSDEKLCKSLRETVRTNGCWSSEGFSFEIHIHPTVTIKRK